MERFNKRYFESQKNLDQLNEVLQLPYSKIIRDATIKRFEFTLESLWKLLQRFLMIYEGLELNSPKSVIRGCFQVSLLTEEETEILLNAIDDRNLTVHTYNEKLTEVIYQNTLNYAPVMQNLYNQILGRVSKKL